jgi:hypothetical protein
VFVCQGKTGPPLSRRAVNHRADYKVKVIATALRLLSEQGYETREEKPRKVRQSVLPYLSGLVDMLAPEKRRPGVLRR